MKTILAIWLGATVFACAANMADFDGDGMPDVWEAAFGLRTNSAAGIDGAYGDPDGDGLPNIAEYRAGYTVASGSVYSNYTWAVAGLAPTNAYSAGGTLPDYWHVAGSNRVHLGWMFTDHDFVDSSWEAQATNRASLYVPDEGDVYGGWSAWERCRMSSAKVSPTVELDLTYIGPRNVDTVTISAFSDLTEPADVVFRVTGYNRTHTLTNVVSGKLKRSSVYWLAVPGTGAWTQGDPIGTLVSQPMSWDRTKLAIELLPTDGHRFVMTLPTPVFEQTGVTPSRVRIRRSRIDGLQTYQTVILDRSYTHDKLLTPMDYLNVLGLDWAFTNVPRGSVSLDMTTYDVYFGQADVLTNNVRALTFTNWFGSYPFTSDPVSPKNGAYIYSARPEFRWKNSRVGSYDSFGSLNLQNVGNTAFKLEILSGTNIIYSTEEMLLPPSDPDTRDHTWQAPVFAGGTLPNGVTLNENALYSWRFACLNAKFTSSYGTWSPLSYFRWAVNSPMGSSGYGEVKALVKYRGPATNLSGRVITQAYTHRGFCGDPAGQYTLTDSGVVSMTNSSTTATNSVLRGLTPSASAGPYYVCAFIDSNGNGTRDAWESWGYANNRGATDILPFDARPFPVAYAVQDTIASVVIEDADTDRDWFPDAWEYEGSASVTNAFLAPIGPSADWDNSVDTRVNPYLITNGVFRN